MFGEGSMGNSEHDYRAYFVSRLKKFNATYNIFIMILVTKVISTKYA